MNVRRLPRPDVFLQSAIANIEFTEWIPWINGLCAVYYNEVNDQDGVLCVWETGEGFFCSISGLKQIVSSDGMIYMLCDDGFVEWDGRDKHSTQATVTRDWHNVQLAAWGCAGYSDFRFRYWLKETNDVVTLPVGVEKVWALGLNGEVLWSYWGQFFLGGAHSPVIALESIPDKMDYWKALQDDWWVAVFESEMILWHAKRSVERLALDDVLDIHVCSNRQEVLILDVNGTLHRWSTNGVMDVLLESSDADGIIGDRSLLEGDEIISIAP